MFLLHDKLWMHKIVAYATGLFYLPSGTVCKSILTKRTDMLLDIIYDYPLILFLMISLTVQFQFQPSGEYSALISLLKRAFRILNGYSYSLKCRNQMSYKSLYRFPLTLQVDVCLLQFLWLFTKTLHAPFIVSFLTIIIYLVNISVLRTKSHFSAAPATRIKRPRSRVISAIKICQAEKANSRQCVKKIPFAARMHFSFRRHNSHFRQSSKMWPRKAN